MPSGPRLGRSRRDRRNAESDIARDHRPTAVPHGQSTERCRWPDWRPSARSVPRGQCQGLNKRIGDALRVIRQMLGEPTSGQAKEVDKIPFCACQ